MSANWIDILRQECQKDSQRHVASGLGVSATQVNQVLKGIYKGDLTRIKKLVEGRFMKRVVYCPILGEISLDKCQYHQEREFAATNPQRVMLYKACNSGCKYSEQPITIKVAQMDSRTAADVQKERLLFYQNRQSELKPTKHQIAKRQQKQQSEDDELYAIDDRLIYLKRIAAGNSLQLNQLLEKELTKLASRYNQLLWSNKYSRSEK